MSRFIFLCLVFEAITNIGCSTQINKPYGKVQTIQSNTVTIISQLAPKEKLDIYNIGLEDIEALPDVLQTGVRDSVQFQISKPTFLYIGTLSNTPLYVRPGDRIIAMTDKSGYTQFANSKHPNRTGELNFFFELNKYFEAIGEKNTVLESKKEESFLDSLNSLRNFSPEFLHDAQHYIVYKNLQYFYRHMITRKDFRQNVKPFPENDSCIYLVPYRSALYNYITLLSNKKNSKGFDFNSLKQIVKNNFSGNTKKEALFMFLNFKMNVQLSDPGYISVYNYFLESYPKDSLSNYLKEAYDRKTLINNSLEKDVYSELLVNKVNKLVPFSQIFQRNKGKLIVLDFWARYCGPCLAEMPYSKKLEAELSDKGVVFIYLSTDHEYDKWVTKINNIGIGNSNRSFLLYLPEKSRILTYFKIRTIPRYVIIDKKGKIISSNAPNPSDPAFEEMLMRNL